MKDKAALVRPPAVKPGDAIAIVSTSSPVTSDELQRLRDYFVSRGYRIRLGDHALAATGYLAGSAKGRAHDLMAAFSDPEVRLIVPATGGRGAAQLLSLLDMDVIRANPTVFTGLSDPSILCNAIAHVAGLATLHCSSGFDFFQPGIDASTEAAFWRTVTGPVAGTTVARSSWRPLRGAGQVVSGPAYGGHLGTNRALVGTEYLPDLTGAVLLIEEMCFSPFDRIDEALTHLRLAGLLDRISALVVGVPVDCSPDDDARWDEMVLRCVGGDFPVLAGVELGHTPRKTPFVIGGRVEIRLEDGNSEITYLDDLVQ